MLPAPRAPNPESLGRRGAWGLLTLQAYGYTTGQCPPHTHREVVFGHRGRRLHWGTLGCWPWLLQTPRSLLPPPPSQGSPFSQARPAQPSGQVQWPETGSQVPPFWQRQECWQSSPYRPAGQAGGQRGEQLAATRQLDPRGPKPSLPPGKPAMGTCGLSSPPQSQGETSGVRTSPRAASKMTWTQTTWTHQPSLGGSVPKCMVLGPKCPGCWVQCPLCIAPLSLCPLSIPCPCDPARPSKRQAQSLAPDSWVGLTLQAGGARPARATAALPLDRVAGGPVKAGADLAAVVPIGVGWAGCRGEGRSGA